MGTINDRFKKIVDTWYDGTTSRLSLALGKNASAFSKIVDGGVSPRAATLQEVCKLLPNLNPAWLLLGEGEMTRSANNSSQPNVPSEVIKAKDDLIRQQAEMIEMLKQYVEDLRRQHPDCV